MSNPAFRISAIATIAALAALPAPPAAAQALNADRSQGELTYFAMAGASNLGRNDDGTGIKLGVNAAWLLPREPWLGGTVFYAHTDGDGDLLGQGSCRNRNRVHTLAAGPTATWRPSGVFSVEGRVFASLNFWRTGCSGFDLSDRGLDIGLGGGVRYQLTPAIALRADIDQLTDRVAARSTLYSVGVGFRF